MPQVLSAAQYRLGKLMAVDLHSQMELTVSHKPQRDLTDSSLKMIDRLGEDQEQLEWTP